MMEIRITAPELSEALNNLANAIKPTSAIGVTNALAELAEAKAETPAVQTTPIPVAPVAPVQPTPIPVAPAAPTTAVPTAAPQYTLEMIAKAGTALIDAGKMGELTALLAKYGVEALTSLNPAQYGVFAADLRAMGASI